MTSINDVFKATPGIDFELQGALTDTLKPRDRAAVNRSLEDIKQALILRDATVTSLPAAGGDR
jgi:hypothetical protein